MIALQDQIRNELAGRFAIKAEELHYLAGGREDNDGILFTYTKDGKKQVLKIGVKEEVRDLERLKEKLKLARYLSESGINIAYPKEGQDGNVYQVLQDGKYYYIASVMDFISGDVPKTNELNPSMVQKWGQLTGKMHAAVKTYPIWRSIPGGEFSWGIEEEMDGFYHWCRNEIVKEKWLEMKGEIQSWEKDRDTYGFIHNDNHQNNILVQGKEITLIDFDCAECTFLLQDLLIPIQGLLFDVAGGMERPITNSESIKRFYDSFLKGYEKETHMEDRWLARLGTLLNYRRLLLYTIMQDWMESDERIRNCFLSQIQSPSEFPII